MRWLSLQSIQTKIVIERWKKSSEESTESVNRTKDRFVPTPVVYLGEKLK